MLFLRICEYYYLEYNENIDNTIKRFPDGFQKLYYKHKGGTTLAYTMSTQQSNLITTKEE